MFDSLIAANSPWFFCSTALTHKELSEPSDLPIYSCLAYTLVTPGCGGLLLVRLDEARVRKRVP